MKKSSVAPHPGSITKSSVAPHPGYVTIGGAIVKREDLKHREDGASAKPIMVRLDTTTRHPGGEVKPIHMEIMEVFLDHLYTQHAIGKMSCQVRLSKADIAKRLNMSPTMRVFQGIVDALLPLQSVTYKMVYHGPDKGETGHGTVRAWEVTLGGFITSHRISGSSMGGTASDVIEVMINSEVARRYLADRPEPGKKFIS